MHEENIIVIAKRIRSVTMSGVGVHGRLLVVTSILKCKIPSKNWLTILVLKLIIHPVNRLQVKPHNFSECLKTNSFLYLGP